MKCGSARWRQPLTRYGHMVRSVGGAQCIVHFRLSLKLLRTRHEVGQGRGSYVRAKIKRNNRVGDGVAWFAPPLGAASRATCHRLQEKKTSRGMHMRTGVGRLGLFSMFRTECV